MLPFAVFLFCQKQKTMVCLFLSLCLLFSSISLISAADKVGSIQKEQPKDLITYSKESGIPVDELKELQDKAIDIDQFIKEYKEASRFPNAVQSGGGGNNQMSPEQFEQLRNTALKGNILISKDQTHYGVNHGHAGIVTTRNQRTVEALGPGMLSKECNLDGWWSTMYTAKVLYHKTCTNSQQLGAADYAYNNLRDKTYALVPNVTSNKLNCATLVWQAYNSQGITLNTVWLPVVGDTCFPRTLNDDPSLACKLNINW